MTPALPAPHLSSEGDGPPVLLLHPLGVDLTVWQPLVRALPGFTTHAYDLPGHGTSPVPGGPLTVVDLADQAARLLRDQVGTRCHVVGVSLGGLVGQALAARAPELVRGLVVADAVAVYPSAMQQMWRERAALVRAGGMAAVIDPTLELWFTAAARDNDTPPVAAARRLLLGMDPEGYARTCETLAGADTRTLLGDISAPTLVVCGEDDAPPFTSAAPGLADAVPDGRLVWLPGVRHAGVFERPEATAVLLGDFLAPV